ncbi:GTP-binding protein, partial [[Eubacterium] cellulosolvens]
MQNVFDFQKKIVLLGDPAVGKTSMIRKFVYNQFNDEYISTLGTKVVKKSLEYDQLLKNSVFNLDLMIWDVMGQEDYRVFHQSACMGSQGALIVADITR